VLLPVRADVGLWRPELRVRKVSIGLGHDGLTHTDPYCATIAPWGSYEARAGEICGACEARRVARCKRCGGPGELILDGICGTCADDLLDEQVAIEAGA
jgi:hypothetical protein